MPEAIGDVDAINEGEGELIMVTSHVKEKKSHMYVAQSMMTQYVTQYICNTEQDTACNI